MNSKYRFIFILHATLLLGLCCSCFSKSNQSIEEVYNLNGKWDVYDLKNGNERLTYELTKEEKMPCLFHFIFISDTGIVVQKDSCFYGESYMGNPMFKFKKYCVKDSAVSDPYFFRQINYSADSIVLVTSKCDMPFNEFFMLSKDSIVIGGDGYLHFLRRFHAYFEIGSYFRSYFGLGSGFRSWLWPWASTS